MYYLYEIEAVNGINQYALGNVKTNNSIAEFATEIDEEALYKAFLFVTGTLGKKMEFSISLLPSYSNTN